MAAWYEGDYPDYGRPEDDEPFLLPPPAPSYGNYGPGAGGPPGGSQRQTEPGTTRVNDDGTVSVWNGSAWVPYDNASGFRGGSPGGRPGGNPEIRPGVGGGNYSGFGGEFGGWPTLDIPPFQSAGEFKPRSGTFAYPEYAAPTAEQARLEPGYQFAAEQARKQAEMSAAGKGIVRSGGTLSDIFDMESRLAGQNYAGVDARQFRNWGANRGAAMEKFITEYGIDRDVFDRHATDVYSGNQYRFNEATGEFAPRQRQRELEFADIYNRWKAQVDAAMSLVD